MLTDEDRKLIEEETGIKQEEAHEGGYSTFSSKIIFVGNCIRRKLDWLKIELAYPR